MRAPQTKMRKDVRKLLGATLLALGAALMAMMILVEDEPGALPLLLVVAGGGWLFALRRPGRNRRG